MFIIVIVMQSLALRRDRADFDPSLSRFEWSDKGIREHLGSTSRYFRPIQCHVRFCMHPHQDTLHNYLSILLITGIV